MRLLVAEARKLATLRSIVLTALAGVALPPLLAAFNARQVRAALDAGSPGYVGEDWSAIGVQEPLLAVAMTAIVGALAVSTEYRRMPAERGGGAQATTTALSTPSPVAPLLVKAGLAAAIALAVGAAATVGSLLVVDRLLGVVPVDADRWAQALRAAPYAALMALMSVAVTALLRNGIVPMVYLAMNSTVVSVGFLLTKVTRWAWFLPDTCGIALVRDVGDPQQPSPWVGGAVMAGWVAVALVAAAWAQSRREA